MLSRSGVSARAVANSCKARPFGTRARRTTVVQISAKKSRQQELDDAYDEQLAYLEARRQKLATRLSKQKGGQASQAPAPAAQAQTPKVKQAVKEPTIQVEVDSKKEKKGGGNPLGFLSSLFGKK